MIPLGLAAAASALLVAAACGGDDGANPDGPPGTPATIAAPGDKIDRTTSPALDAPASRFSILLEDVGLQAYLTDIPATFELTAASYSKTDAFNSAAEGDKLLTQWEYADGYETALIPEGRNQAILNGAHVIYVETHLLYSDAGAKKMYEYLVSRIRSNGGQAVNTGPVGNESSAWRAVGGNVPGSTIAQAFHRMIFRRGNLVAVVLTIGADPFMKVETARGLALLIDEKALGTKEAIVPTPTSNFTPPADRVKTAVRPTPAATPSATATR